MPLTVKTPVYEGPLDLLLDLIEKRKLLINDISLAQVTDEYIERVNAMHELPVGETTEFVSLAATLLLIKSRSLLPTLTISDEESRDIKELEYRLSLYQHIKEAAALLQKNSRMGGLREGSAPLGEPIFLFDNSISLAALRAAAGGLIAAFPQSLSLPKVAVKKMVSLEETIEKLSSRITSAFKLSFKEFSGHSGKAAGEAKHSIIISFLALLELVKQGIIKANQHDDFGDITLEADSVSTPVYE